MRYGFIFVTGFWLLAEIWYSWRLRDHQQKNTDQRSLFLLWCSVIIGVSFGVCIALWKGTAFQQALWIQSCALVIMIVGIIGRARVIAVLGEFFTVNVRIHEQHELKTDGFFRRVRHPSYSFLLLTFLGFCIILNHWIAALAVMIPVVLAFHRRIVLEETVLSAHFGMEYKKYQSQTTKLIPWIW